MTTVVVRFAAPQWTPDAERRLRRVAADHPGRDRLTVAVRGQVTPYVRLTVDARSHALHRDLRASFGPDCLRRLGGAA